uniref:Uncharacterized protein n=1 Tax=Rousettus aegyptiacus TaxID=9407 RepID=A0A7J8JGW7_ROUAE|nr:hypothetical protein HJG63_010372 [Rousettus aegyptiacus]
MVLGLWHQRERLFKALYVVQIFILAGVLYYYVQRSVGKTAPAHEVAGESSQPVGETLRPVWGPMNKCYPVTAQRRRIKSGKKAAPEQAMTPKATGRLSDTAPKEEADSLSQDDRKARSPRLEAASPIRSGEGVAEEEATGIPGWTGDEKAQKESAVYLEASGVESKEERPGGWVSQLLRKLRLGWFPASDVPKTPSHE